jgi:hypothetical protein
LSLRRLVAGAVLELKEEADPRSLRNDFAHIAQGSFLGTRAILVSPAGRFGSIASMSGLTWQRFFRTARTRLAARRRPAK